MEKKKKRWGQFDAVETEKLRRCDKTERMKERVAEKGNGDRNRRTEEIEKGRMMEERYMD